MRDHPGAGLIVATLLVAATTTPGMAAGADLRLVTDEIAPGVQRVLGDGVHEVDGHWVEAGRDGSVWLAEERRYTELGGEAVLEWGPGPTSGVLFDVAPDGTVWVVEDTPGKPVVKIRSFDGDRWTTHRKARADSVEGWAIDIGADGTVWAAWPDGEARDPRRASVVASLTDDGWRMLERTLPGGGLIDLLVTDDGDVWALEVDGPPLRYTDDEWQPPTVSDVAAGDEAFAELTLTDDVIGSVGRDGTVWLTHRGIPGPMDALGSTDAILRFDGEGWTGWSLPAELTELGRPSVAPDGSVWIPDDWPNGRAALYHFDSGELTGFLPGRSVYGEPLVASDGSVWVVARSRERPRDRETWRITPQEVGSAP